MASLIACSWICRSCSVAGQSRRTACTASAETTVCTLSIALKTELEGLGFPLGLTVSEATSGNRALTTLIAAWLREQVTLDNGTQPIGVRFQTKHGHIGAGEGVCWACWMRRLDAGLSDELVTADEGQPFEVDYSPYAKALDFHNISSR